ncbi:MAG: YozE family protein [Paracoccaceae bacterium]|nr:YozE family protein [Paracoccaceae bacterium]
MDEYQSFLEYIKSRRITDTPAGDFTHDARRDRNLPDAQSWDELRRYLSRRTSNPNVIAAAHSVWSQYVRKNRLYLFAKAHPEFFDNS